jgi:hypothetical protein
MRWGWCLVTLTVLASVGKAQVPVPLGETEPILQDDAAFAVEEDSGRLTGNRNFPNFIGFLSNPLQNIEPRAVTQVWPVFGSTWVSPGARVLPEGDFQLYGAGLNVALSDRLSIGANQGGYAATHFQRRERPVLFPRLRERLPRRELDGDREGWLNLGGFIQYTVIEDVPNQFLATAGLRIEVPSGSQAIFQGNGPVHLAPYVTVGKELGQFHVLATTGYQFPTAGGSDTTNLFYFNLHLDRQCFGWLYPLVELNCSYHVTSVDIDFLPRRGLIDFGDFESSGNILTLAVGANAVLVRDRLEIGAVYGTPLATQRDFDFNSLLVKMVLRY